MVGELTQWLGSLNDLAKDLGSIPSVHMAAQQPFVSLVQGETMTFCWCLLAPKYVHGI